jgi:hypothetical protein
VGKMNEIDKIKLLNELNDGQETLNLWKHYSKYLDIKKNKIEYSNEELDELIEFFEKREYFEQCENLKKLK